MNVTGMIKRLGGKKYTVTTSDGAGSYSAVDGSFVPGPTNTIQVLGSVQPLTPEEIVSIPEGDRTKERKRFYSFPDLENLSVTNLSKSDLVNVDGISYQVESVEHWPNYSKAIIARVNTDAN